MVDKQAAAVVKTMLKAHGSKRKGASLKSLVLGANMQAKKATFKVAYSTLKYLPVIKRIVAACQLLETYR